VIATSLGLGADIRHSFKLKHTAPLLIDFTPQTYYNMKLLTIASAILATASASSLFGGLEVTFDDSLSVPGNNPLNHCDNPKDDILDLKSVDLNPNPPKA
jgi:hypothetical protein